MQVAARGALRGGTLRLAHIRPLRAPCVQARTFASRSRSAQSARSGGESFSQAGGGTKTDVERSMAYFLDAQVACRNKRCRANAPGDGIGANPETCGEDSFFVSAHTVGVADGVGGWNDSGVDPGVIARSLMRNAAKFVKDMDQGNGVRPQEVLAHAYARAVEDEEVEAGSTTACLVRLKERADGKPVLEYSNLGDSGFVLIRNGAVVFRSKFQCYGRAPYQLAKIPPRFKKFGAIENHPEDADSGEIDVQDGDIVVLATDGVWDNFASDLLTTPAYYPPVVTWRWQWHNELSGLVEVISEDEKQAARNVVRAALRHNLKPDDITVIVAKVKLVAAKL